MQIKIGTKIKELRKYNGRKQEDLANALGVTCQAVSRWEANGGYPDMEMIPSIANYFHISIDELFGYNSDREEKIKNILDKASKIITKQGFKMYIGSLSQEIEDCVNMLRAASEEFPNEPKILLKLAQSLNMLGWNKYGAKGRVNDASGIYEEDTGYNLQNIYWREALYIYERVLKSNPSVEDREAAVYQLTVLYCRMGEHEKAKILANEQNSFIICKERLLSLATVGEESIQYQEEEIMALLSGLDFAIFHVVSSKPNLFNTEYEKQLLLSIVNLYEMIFTDGRCGKYHWNIANLYLTLARREVSESYEIQDILFYFDKGFDHIKEYERIYNQEMYDYTAPLVSNLKTLKKGDLNPFGEDFWKKELKLYSQEIYDELSKNPKYTECFK